jgi:hypothetical protein
MTRWRRVGLDKSINIDSDVCPFDAGMAPITLKIWDSDAERMGAGLMASHRGHAEVGPSTGASAVPAGTTDRNPRKAGNPHDC